MNKPMAITQFEDNNLINLLNLLNDFAYIFDMSGKLLFLNPPAAWHYGSVNEVAKDVHFELYSQASANHPRGSITIQRADSPKIHAPSRQTYCQWQGQQVMVCITRNEDILKEAKLESGKPAAGKSAEVSSNMYQAALDTYPYITWIKDIKGHYQAINEAMATALHLPDTGSAIGLTDYDLFPAEIAATIVENDQQVINSRTPMYREECFNPRGDEEWLMVNNSPLVIAGELVGTAGISHDITATKKIEQALADSTQQIDQIFTFLPDPTYAVNLKGEVIAWNRAIEKLTGIAKKDILGKGNYEYSFRLYGERRPSILDLLVSSSKKAEAESFFNKLRYSDTGVYAETPSLPNLGEKPVILAGTATALCDRDGEVIGAIEQLRDITWQRKMEETLRKLLKH